MVGVGGREHRSSAIRPPEPALCWYGLDPLEAACLQCAQPASCRGRSRVHASADVDGVRRGGGDDVGRRRRGPRSRTADHSADPSTRTTGRPSASARRAGHHRRGRRRREGPARHRPEAGDFEIVERGKSQTVRQVVYVQVIGPDGTAGVPADRERRSGASGLRSHRPDAAARSAAAGRRQRARVRPSAPPAVLAIVVDDLGLSFESTAYVRQMLTRYVDTKIAPGDLVAIIRTAGGVGTLQQFTTDRRLLHAAIDRVRWSLQSRKGVGAFEAVVPASSTSAGHQQSAETIDDAPRPRSTTRPARSAPSSTCCAASRRCRAARAWCSSPRGSTSASGTPRSAALVDVHARDGSRQPRRRRRLLDRCPRPADRRSHRRGRSRRRQDDRRCRRDGAAAPTPARSGPRASQRPRRELHGLAGIADLPRPADRRLRGPQHQRPGRRAGARRRRHARLLPARLRHGDPVNERWDPNDIRIRVKRPGLTRPGAARPLRAGRQGAPARRGPGGSAGRRRAVAVRDRRHRRAADDAVRARQDGRLLRPLAVLHRSGRPDLRRSAPTAGTTPTCRCCSSPSATTAQTGRLRPGSRCRCASTTTTYRLLRQRGLLYSARLAIKEAGRLPDPRRRAGRSLEGRSARARSSSRCRRSARAASRCRAS